MDENRPKTTHLGSTSLPGLDQGVGVPPGETPAGESSTGSETGPRGDLSRGWGKGPLIVISVVVVLCAGFFLAYAVLLDL
ncbi:DUF6480 family protein [Streptomyces albipurpureus]|uniref:DUF6480 family protein n=1 Tax=Streptomyces albipurpureus TaxID=2897419 RepID=A0ABT0UZY2_9ACTN|nr:DUF6480 family protein [Streptomyces sp. CWNU-1]MCM2394128.1 DUF6480 family protein [Streptomyces sp. CWNU-1]